MAVPAHIRLLTIGYEGKSIQEFISELVSCAVRVLVDVRELPLSRKPGFSKSRLSAQLRAKGIDYVHMRSLGSPPGVRRQLREDHNYKAFFDAYAVHLASNAEAVTEVRELLAREPVCLMCYEAEAERCHRSALASAVARASDGHVEVEHQ